jgi:hypothetical protein
MSHVAYCCLSRASSLGIHLDDPLNLIFPHFYSTVAGQTCDATSGWLQYVGISVKGNHVCWLQVLRGSADWATSKSIRSKLRGLGLL